MLARVLWHLAGLVAAGGLCYGVYVVWGLLPAWTKGTNFNDLRIIAALLIFVIALSLGEAIWARLPKRPKNGIGGGKP